MAQYTPRTWTTGDTITAAELNAIEQAAAGAAVAADLTGSYLSLTQRPVNVLQMPNPLQSAVGDGSTHPLSSRFANLAAAQAVFPRATALTEEIDRHALQYALDNYDVVDYGHRSLRIDAPVYTSDGTYRPMGNQKLYGTGWLVHNPSVAAHAILRSGNSRNIASDSSPTSAEAPDCPRLDIQVKVDGNKATLSGDKAAVYMVATSYGLFDVEVKNPHGCGFYTCGTTGGTDVLGQTLKRIEVYGSTSLYAARASNHNRKINYQDVYCHDNVQHGFFLDCSEAEIGQIRASGNGGHGVWIHNVFSLVGGHIRATENGQHGVLLSGVTNSLIDNILAMNNGTVNDGGAWADLYLDASALNYGATFGLTVARAILGPTSQFGSAGLEKYALYIEDGVNNGIDLDVRYTGAPATAYHRLPSSLGSLAVRELYPSSAQPVWAAGGATQFMIKQATTTVNNVSTPQPDATLAANLEANAVYEFKGMLLWTGTAAQDIKLSFTVPTGAAINWHALYLGTSATGTTGTTLATQAHNTDVAQLGAVDAVQIAVMVEGSIVVGSTAGAVTPNWSQAAAGAFDLVMGVGSYIRYDRRG